MFFLTQSSSFRLRGVLNSSSSLINAFRWSSTNKNSNDDNQQPRSDFLASLLKSTKQQQQQQPQQQQTKQRFDPKSLKLDLFPGLSKREEINNTKKKQQQQQQRERSEQTEKSTTSSQSDRIAFPKFDFGATNSSSGPSKKSFFAPNANEVSLSMISVSRRVGDWEEATRIASKHLSPSTTSKNDDAQHWYSLLSAESFKLGLLAQAAWACSNAMTHESGSSQPQPPQQTNEETPQENVSSSSSSTPTSFGPVEALDDIVLTVIDRFNLYYNHDQMMMAASPQQQQQPQLYTAQFLRATTGNLLALSEAFRSCGGVDLVVTLDRVVGTYLRAHWQREGLLLETQRWNHEVIKVYDDCDDWEGALNFFLEHVKASTPENIPEKKTESTTTTTIEQNIESSKGSMFQFKKQSEFSSPNDQEQEKNPKNNTPSIFGAATIATLIELLNRNNQHHIVTTTLLGGGGGNKNSAIIRPAEAAAIARAYSVLINSYAYGTCSNKDGSNNYHRDKGGSTNSTTNKFGSEIKMPKLVLDGKMFKTK